MLGEELVGVTFKAVDATLDVLKKLLEFINNKESYKSGEMTKQDLMKQMGSKRIESQSFNGAEFKAKELKDLKVSLKKEGIDFNYFYDKNKGNCTITYYANNETQIKNVLEDFLKNTNLENIKEKIPSLDDKESFKKQLDKAKDKANTHNETLEDKVKDRSAERGR